MCGKIVTAMKEGLTKQKLAEIIAVNTGTTHRESLGYLEHLLEVIKSTLETGEKIKVAGFGNFEVSRKRIAKAETRRPAKL